MCKMIHFFALIDGIQNTVDYFGTVCYAIYNGEMVKSETNDKGVASCLNTL